MKYKLRRRLYSQNFLRSPKLIAKLIRHSTVGKNDTILEIGPGKGIITEELLKVAGKVAAIELDRKLYLHLKQKFDGVSNLGLLHGDFLNLKLPAYPFKVFANIPFVITADVIRKLTSDKSFQEGYLVVQKEAAQKLIGKPLDIRNQMVSVLLKPWFEISIFWKFNRSDFYPRPSVDVLMIKIKRLDKPLIECQHKALYENFIIYSYNRYKFAKLDFDRILKSFNDYIRNATDVEKQIVTNAARKIINEQNQLHKIHRTRKDKKWKSLK